MLNNGNVFLRDHGNSDASCENNVQFCDLIFFTLTSEFLCFCVLARLGGSRLPSFYPCNMLGMENIFQGKFTQRFIMILHEMVSGRD